MTVHTEIPKRHLRGKPRGRSLAPDALDALRQLLGDEREQPQRRQRDLLIEHLHVIQDALGHLPLTHLRALAAYMNLPMAEVYETATFYAHFDVIHDDQSPPPALTLRVCDSLSCQLAGADALRNELAAGTDPAEVRVLRAPAWAAVIRRLWWKWVTTIWAMPVLSAFRRPSLPITFTLNPWTGHALTRIGKPVVTPC
ncbi:NAD(P)H-dependent oxidoreductase subunit E [Vreelandella azerica]|uniref:NADH-quinone oxidoreductase subunit NuoE family protein n=1 Tax=Vreelandella azerica TaxID=2732867 RepID=UPI001F2DA1E0|nr:NAD(P)H-dependent oxidoreductase subunit E [Halomonas azerica]